MHLLKSFTAVHRPFRHAFRDTIYEARALGS
jgi:hypothetical protein